MLQYNEFMIKQSAARLLFTHHQMIYDHFWILGAWCALAFNVDDYRKAIISN